MPTLGPRCGRSSSSGGGGGGGGDGVGGDGTAGAPGEGLNFEYGLATATPYCGSRVATNRRSRVDRIATDFSRRRLTTGWYAPYLTTRWYTYT